VINQSISVRKDSAVASLKTADVIAKKPIAAFHSLASMLSLSVGGSLRARKSELSAALRSAEKRSKSRLQRV
jgi:hypothetical protein